jgi:catechol 2,3-dioxygenase-like lactoylglutathione lyase family enzyme
MSDRGLTHVALPATDINESAAFYERYAAMKIVHRRIDEEIDSDVVWLSDLTRPFVLVLIKVSYVTHPLSPLGHLGVGCESREEVDRLCQQAREEGILREGPEDWGPPVGYWAFISDPDGHMLEVSCGQEVGLTVEQAI